MAIMAMGRFYERLALKLTNWGERNFFVPSAVRSIVK
jgi:hypothetical protein